MIPIGRRAATLLAAALLGPATAFAGPAVPAQAAPAAVDLSVMISGQTAEVSPGQEMYVGVLTSATADVDPASVRVVVTLPTGVTYVPAGDCGTTCPPTAGPCEASGATVTCTVTDPQAIADRQYGHNIKLRFGADLEPGTQLPIKVTVSSAGEDATPDNNASETVVGVRTPTDVGITVENVSGPSGPGNVVKYTYVIRNYGPATLPGVRFGELTTPLAFGTDDFSPASVGCISETSPTVECSAAQRLAPGEQFRATRTVSVPADSKLWGQRVQVRAGVSDLPAGGANAANNTVTFELDFTGGPGTASPSPSPSPSPSNGTAAPGDGGTGGGLPVTGSATLPVVGTGLALLLLGAGAVLLTRRRRG